MNNPAQELPLDDGAYESPKRLNRLMTLTELRNQPMSQPIVSGLLYSNQEHVVFGPQGGSKTAVLLDLALHCIYALDWMGRKTITGKVVYICGEGGGKVLANRIDAWLKHQAITGTFAADEFLRVTEFPVYMLDPANVDEFLDLLLPEGEVMLIIVDTLSANFGGGDENAVADMGRFLEAIRRLRLATRAGVVIAHHTGHHDQTRPQGSNKIRRDVDIELLVNRDAKDESLFGILGGGMLKNRNGAGCGMIPYRLTEVTLDETDCFGNSLTSIVVTPTDDEPCFDATQQQRSRRGRNQIAALKGLRQWADSNGLDTTDEDGLLVPSTDWIDIYKSVGLDRKQAHRVLTSFVESGVFSFSVGGSRWHPAAT